MAGQVRQGRLGPPAKIRRPARLMNHLDVSRLDQAPRVPGAPLLGAAWQVQFARADVLLGHITEVPAAILIVVETIVLLAGVISRYLFHSPLVWSDELAAVMFLWLAM